MALHITLLDGKLHDRSGFSCGIAALDDYLHQRAGQHQRDGIATTHVLTDNTQPARILGFCALSAAQLHLSELQQADLKRLPAYPVPAMRMGRLAVSASEQGKGYGQLQTMGVRVLIVDAKDAQAAAFYERYGFRPTTSKALSLYLPISAA